MSRKWKITVPKRCFRGNYKKRFVASFVTEVVMQVKYSLISLSLFILFALLWKNLFEIHKWNEQFYQEEEIRLPKRNVQEITEISHIESNCGIQYTCPVDSFPVYLSTGIGGDYPPKLCISGKHLINPETMGVRGLNAAVVEPNRFDIVGQRNFDTYRFNKTTEIMEWLGDILDNDILIIFTSDEASLKLSQEVAMALNELGSGMIHNLRFRSQWFMITQKGTTGFTIYENITFSKNNYWGEMIEFRSCIPRRIPKQRTIADDILHENRMRTQFCADKKENKYRGFCHEARFELIIPALLTNRSLIGNLAYSSPLFLFASNDFELLTAFLDSLLHQSGVFLPLMTVLYEEHQTDVPQMAQIYGMQSHKIKFAKNYLEKLRQARKLSQKEHPKQPFIIVIDQNVILSPDFLFFMAQTIQIIKSDDTVSAISAWSPNCYSHDGDVHLSFRVEGSPKYAALVPLKARNDIFGDMIVPDVSRIQGPEVCHLPSLEADNWIMRPQDLTKERYFNKLVMLQQLGQVIDLQVVLTNCSVAVLKHDVNVIYLNYDESTLSNVALCLGVASDQFGIYEGIVRLSVSKKTVLLITNESTFYRSRPIPSSLALTKQSSFRTSNNIGSSYRPPYYFGYERKERGRVPDVELSRPYSVSDTYSSTYNTSYIRRADDRDLTNLMKKFRFFFAEYPKTTCAMPKKFPKTEYRDEYLEKPLPKCVQGWNVEQLSSCPMVLTGRDEREPVPLSTNIGKYLDIYVSTARQDFRRYTEQEQRGIATKEVITCHETMEIPKGRGFGMRTPALAGQDLERRDKNMMDTVFSKQEFKLRNVHKVPPMVPPHGIKSEFQSAYTEPTGTARRHIFDSFIEYPERTTSSTTQAICPPGMYRTDYDSINLRISPQTAA